MPYCYGSKNVTNVKIRHSQPFLRHCMLKSVNENWNKVFYRIGWETKGSIYYKCYTLKWQTFSFLGADRLTTATKLLENNLSTMQTSPLSIIINKFVRCSLKLLLPPKKLYEGLTNSFQISHRRMNVFFKIQIRSFETKYSTMED